MTECECATDRSNNENVVEYAIQTMFKKKSISFAAKDTANKHSGYSNVFFGSGVTLIVADKLENAIWQRMIKFTANAMSKMLVDKYHYALDGTTQHFNQSSRFRKQLKNKMIESLGYNPFLNDDHK